MFSQRLDTGILRFLETPTNLTAILIAFKMLNDAETAEKAGE